MSVDKLREWFKKFRRGEYCISMSNLLAKCVYRILRFSHRYPNDLQRYSFALSEKKEISRVAAIYNSIKWTKDQNTEFNQYWKSHLGRTIPPYWHKLYECYSGNYNIRYFPGILCTSNLQFRLNPFQQCDPFSNPFLNKALYEVFFGGTSEGLQKGAKTPRTLGVLFNGLY